MNKDIKNKVIEIINNKVSMPGNIITELTSNLKDDLTMDSLERIQVTMELEDEFDIEISDENMEKFVTVKDIVTYITILKEA